MEFTPSAHQAAGHEGILEAGAVFAKLTTQQEIDFYAQAKARQEANQNTDLGADLYDWMPVFMGTLTQGAIKNPEAITLGLDTASDVLLQVDPSSKEKYIVLQNLLHGYKNPCILDIKLGAVLVDDTVSEDKRQRLARVSAETTSGSLHFRVCGLKLFNGTSSEKPKELFVGQDNTISVEESETGLYLQFNKFFGRSLTDSKIKDCMNLFFVDSLPSALRKSLIRTFYNRLQLFYNCLVDTEVRIKSGSLFFCYEADPSQWDILEEEYLEKDPLFDDFLVDDGSDDATEDSIRIGSLSKLKFIDFAHSKFTAGQGCDENILVGVENLLSVFKELITEN